MKKYPRGLHYRRVQYRRRKKLERRKRRRELARPRNRIPQTHELPPQVYKITAPTEFSLAGDPDRTLGFFKSFREKLPIGDLRIEIDLGAVTKIDPDAVAVFVAIMESVPHANPVSGNVPRDKECRRRLHDFGFFNHVRSGFRPGKPAGRIQLQRTDTQVRGQAAKEIIQFGLKMLDRKSTKHGPTYSVFTEVMSNTCQHANAGSTKGQHPWLAAAYYDDEKQAACFTAVDLGVGILGSFNFRQRYEARQAKLAGVDQGEKLRMLLCGEIRSRSGDPHRGRGLPNIRESCELRRISNLSILSNKALARVAHSKYHKLKIGFEGTIIYWELGKEDV